ncbi:MAG: hypothetical protein U9R75_03800 [Candidatus Thermoplasmatota archaeon]|nr:hypothetical protein [Candidatus Thermoplasmatota archaeon]
MKWRTMLTALVLAVTLSVGTSDAETEPNDSLDTPEVLLEGDTDGELNTNGTSEDLREKDIFKLDLPGGYLVYYSLKKTDTANTEITLLRYSSDLNLIDDPYYGENILQIPGEVFEDQIANLGDPDSIYLVLSGNGTYTIHVKYFDLEDPEEPEDQYDTIFLKDHDTVQARVYTIRYRGMEYQDTDRYVIQLESNQDVTITIRKTAGDGEVHAHLYENIYSSYNSDEAVLRESGDVERLTYSGNYYVEDEIYLDIEGEGEYEVRVRIKDPPQIGGLIMGITGGVMCLVILLSFSPYIIAAIVLIVYIRYDKKKKMRKKEEAKKKARSSSPPMDKNDPRWGETRADH